MKDFIFTLPHINALLNATSGIFLITGYVLIRRRKISAHRRSMIAAFIASIIFLISYVLYHSLLAYYLGQGPTKFKGEGIIRPVYFFILITHTFLAIIIVPFVIITLRRGLKGNYDKHRRIARWTLPLWLYVSVTGVIVYLMLYQLYPSR
jgi:protein SCO1/2/putative membrane protein